MTETDRDPVGLASVGSTRIPRVNVERFSDDFRDARRRARSRNTERAVEQALVEGDFGRYLMLHDKSDRFDKLLSIQDRLSNKLYYELLGDTWTTSEYVSQYFDEWYEAFTVERADRHYCMTPGERTEFSLLSESIRIYRGHTADNANGLSWTTDKDLAIWFANRFKEDGPQVTEGMIDKKWVLAYFNRRNEHEIVAHPDSVIELETYSMADRLV